MAETAYPAPVLRMISRTFLKRFLFSVHFPCLISFFLCTLPEKHCRGSAICRIVFPPPPLRWMASMHSLRFRELKFTRSLLQTSWQLRLINESQDNWYPWWRRCLTFEILTSRAFNKAFLWVLLLCLFLFLFTPHWSNLSSMHFLHSVTFSVRS